MELVTGSRLIVNAVRARLRPCVLGTAGGVAYAIGLVLLPIPAGRLVDTVLVDGDLGALPTYLAAFAGIAVARALSGALRRYQAFELSIGVAADLRERIYAHCQRLSLVFHDRVGAGDLMSRASADVTVVEQFVDVIPYTVQTVLVWLAGMGAMVALDWRLGTAVSAAFIPAMVLAVSRARRLDVLSRDVQLATGAYGRFVEESVSGIRLIKGFGLDRQRSAQAAENAEEVGRAGAALGRRRAAYVGWVMATPALTMVVVIGFGGWLCLGGTLSPGTLFAFLQYVVVLSGPVRFAGHNLARTRQALAGATRIAEVLAVEPAPPWQGGRVPSGDGRLVFDGVTFGYHPGIPVLRDLSLSIEPGRTIGLVGASGAGKTTLVQLVPRFYEPWLGRILLDGMDVSQIEPRALRREVALVFQETILFTGTLWDNLALGDENATETDVRRAAEIAGASGFIAHLPNGFDTVVGERGQTLSGGQRQRLAIARAVLRRPRVLLLDDPVSAVDAATQDLIHSSLDRIVGDSTTIVVTNHLGTVQLMDEVVLLAQGRVAVRGPHEQLLGLEIYRRALALGDEVPA